MPYDRCAVRHTSPTASYRRGARVCGGAAGGPGSPAYRRDLRSAPGLLEQEGLLEYGKPSGRATAGAALAEGALPWRAVAAGAGRHGEPRRLQRQDSTLWLGPSRPCTNTGHEGSHRQRLNPRCATSVITTPGPLFGEFRCHGWRAPVREHLPEATARAGVQSLATALSPHRWRGDSPRRGRVARSATGRLPPPGRRLIPVVARGWDDGPPAWCGIRIVPVSGGASPAWEYPVGLCRPVRCPKPPKPRFPCRRRPCPRPTPQF